MPEVYKKVLKRTTVSLTLLSVTAGVMWFIAALIVLKEYIDHIMKYTDEDLL